MRRKILILPGDGIGPEIVAVAEEVLYAGADRFGVEVECERELIGGAAIDAGGSALPERTLAKAGNADAILLGAVGGGKWDSLETGKRPEKALLRLRSELELFANLRPAVLYPQLAGASTLKPEYVSGLDLLIIRELTGGIYFGQPRGVALNADGEREGVNTYRYTESEIRRIAKVAFEAARKRNRRLVSVDKANVLEVTVLWRDVMEEVAALNYPDVELSHMYVDNAAMQLVRAPKQFDVMVTGNMFGDILSDCAAMLTGSIGMLPSASLDANGKGMYEPIHGSAPDIAGQDIANPLATILSVSMMLRYSLDEAEMADRVDAAVNQVLDDGVRTRDIHSEGMQEVSCSAMGDAVVAALRS